jgi:MSHA pilin protein MshA
MKSSMNQRGFTLIELVVVITILGILAAFAVPRFAGLEVRARVASVQALGGSIRSGSALAHALWLASGQPGTVDMEGNDITIANGYPNRGTVNLTLADDTGFDYDAATGMFTIDGASTDAACNVTYTAPAAANNPPSIVVTVTDCS